MPRRGYKQTQEHISKRKLFRVGNKIALGHKHSDEHKRKISEALRGNTFAVGNKNCLGRVMSPETRQKISASLLGRKSTIRDRAAWRIKNSGPNHYNWKGGITPSLKRLRRSVEYKVWRTAVYERDNYTCQWCKKKEEVSGKLNADHIKAFSLYPKLRFEVSNGRTLCITCHHKRTAKQLKTIGRNQYSRLNSQYEGNT